MTIKGEVLGGQAPNATAQRKYVAWESLQSLLRDGDMKSGWEFPGCVCVALNTHLLAA